MTTPTFYGVTKVNGNVLGGVESLTLPMDFYALTTSVNILVANDASGSGTAASQAALNKLVEIISERGQPVITGIPTNVSTGTVAASYVFTFAIEHKGSWSNATPTLVNEIGLDGIDYGFTNSNTSVVINSHI